MKSSGTAFTQLTRVLAALACLCLGLIGVLIPVLPGVPFLLLGVWLAATAETQNPGVVTSVRIATLKLARLVTTTADHLVSRLRL